MNLNMPRMMGKSLLLKAALDDAIASGEHTHLAKRDGIECFNGPDDCAVRMDSLHSDRRYD